MNRAIVYVATFLLFAVNQATVHGEITEVERMVLENRSSLETGMIVVESLDFDSEEDSEPTAKTIYRIWFDESRNSTLQMTGRATWPFRPFSKTHTILTNDGIVRRDFDLQNPNSKVVAHYFDKSDVSSFGAQLSLIFDPRLVGTQPVHFDVLHSCTQRQFIGNPNRHTSSSETIDWNGHQAVAVTYGGRKWTNKIVVDVDRNHSVLFGSITTDKDKYEFENEVAEFPMGDRTIWFPSRVTYRHMRNGKLRQKSVANISEASFNMPVDPQNLTVAGLGLEVGALVADSRDAERRIWDGYKINKSRELSPPQPRSANRFPIWSFFVLAAGCLGFFIQSKCK